MDVPSAAPAWPTESAPPPRPSGLSGWLLTAAVILFVMGALAILGGLLIGVVMMVVSAAPQVFEPGGTDAVLGAMTTLVVFFGIVLGAAGILHIVAGVGVLRRAMWGRVMGMVVALLGVILTVVSTVWNLVPSSMVDPFTGEPYPPLTEGEIVLNVAMTAATVGAYVLVVAVLVRRGAEFDR